MSEAREAYAKHIARIVAGAVTIDRGARRIDAIDLSCGRGDVLVEVASRLPESSRIVAVCDDRAQLDAVHARLAGGTRRIYPRFEAADRLPFADGVFDRAWAGLVTTQLEPLRAALRQAIRVLRPGGQLVVVAVLRDTLMDFMRIVTKLMNEHEDSLRMRPLVLDQTRSLDKAGWEEAVRRSGGIEIDLSTHHFEWKLDAPLSQNPVMLEAFAPMWLGPDAKSNAETLHFMDSMVKEPVTLPVSTVRVVCRRGMTES